MGPYTVQADANGNFVDTSFTTDLHDDMVRFFLTATGGTSGFVAQNTFTDASPILSVTVVGPSGSGSVSSADSQITNCTAAVSPGHNCTHTYGANFSTTLTETPNSGFSFIGWSGSSGCTGTSTTCAASANGNNTFSATATFAANQAPTITSANSTTFTAGTTGSFTATASGVPAPTFTETGTLPSGVTLSSAGLLSGTATVAGSFPITITASNGVLPNATQNFTLTVNPGAVSSGTSTASANPTSVVADGSTISTITVTLEDANNNPVSGKTVTLSQGTGSSTISAASGASNASGVVTFTVKDTKAETVIYTAKDTTDNVTITQTASVTFATGPVSATKSTVTANPTSVTADGSTTSTITVTLLDANNNPVSGKTVTLSQGTGSSTISAASGASNASGVVTFTVKDTKAESVTYTATDSTDSTTITQTASVTFTAGTVNATKSTVTANPTSVTADGSTTSTITVMLFDTNNNPVSGKTVTLSQGTGSSTISAASGASNASGVVTFTVKDTKAETVTYTAKDATDNITITQTAAVTFTPGAAAKLAFAQQPTNTAAGSSITPAVTVQVQDANGNAVTSGTGSTASIVVAIGTNPSGGTLSGTLTQTAVNGVATFSNLSINKTGTAYTLAASSNGLAAGTSNTFNITPGTATQLVFSSQPSNTAAGSSITPAVTVQVEDANNNVVTTSTAAVAMAIGTNPSGGTLSGTTSVNAVNGIATFSNLSINKTGTGYALAASSTGLTGATSNAFNITPGTASKLAFSQQPTNTQAGSSITPAVTVQVEDANNNLVTTSTASIVVAIGTNAGGGTLSGTLTQSAVNGVATFTNLSINKTGTGYTLAASSTGLAGTVSNGFNITAGAASKLAFNVQPSTATAGQAISPAVTVQVQDANGNVVTTDASSISITISSPGAFSGSSTATVSASSGVATFSNLVPTVAGTFTLSASDGLLTSATSNSFTVNAGALAKFVIANISSPQTAGVAFNVTVTAQDANGNTVANYNGDGNKANLTSTGALVGSPITTASFTNGMVVQSVTITNTGNFTITAVGTGQGNGIGGVPSNLFTVNAGPAASLTVSAPASATAGTAFNFTVTAKDSLGNVATGYAGAVRFSSTDAQAVLPANSALTNGTGTFSATLKTAGTRTITGTDTVTSSIAGVSGNITVSAGPATALVVSAPTSATAGTAFNFTVTAKDAFSNVATGYAGMVKFSSTDAQAVLPANSALTNGTGTFSATLKTAGTQIITATDTVTSSVTGSSGNITVSAGSAAAISAFSGSGQNTTVGMAFANPLVALVQDGFGNPVSGVAVTFAAPNSGPSGTFNNSMTNIVAATDATGHAGTTFTANTVAGVYAVTASTSGVATSASFSLANLAGAITHLALTPATATITAGGNQVFMAEGLDSYNNPAGDVTSATIFIIAPDGSCGAPNPGNSTCTATVADMNGSSHTVTGTYMNSATGSASLTVNAASPTQLVITSSAFAIIAGQCSGNITVTSQDQYGNASNVSSATQLNLSSASGTGKFYSDSSCQTPIPVSNGKISVNMAANSSTQTFAYADTTPSPLPDSTTTITAADDATVLTSGSQAETILQLVFTTPSFTVTQNTCSAQITLTAKNAKGTATNVTVAATLGLTSTSNGATFYSDNTCAMAITPTGAPLASDVTLGSGASVVNFSYEDSAAGNPTITAAIGGYSVAQQEQIGTPPSVTSNPSGQAVTYGSNAMFTAAASGTPTPTVQWQVSPDGTNWNNVGDGGVYSGATTTTLTLTLPPVSLSGNQYRAVFTNAVGSANSNAASLTVNPEPLMVSIIGDPTKTYDATTTATLTSANFSISGLVGTDKFTVTQNTGTYASANAGSGITVTASLSASNFTPYGSTVANNYSFPASASGTGTISRKSVMASITASDKNYDGTDAATITSCTIPGKVGNDDVACSVPAGNATFASSSANSTAQTVTATGITLTGTAAGNYTLSSTTSTTTAKINTAALIITASSGMMMFGGAPPMISAMYSGFVNGETPANLTAQPVCGTNATSASPVGSYMSSCSGAVDTNYTISYVPGVVTVTAASTMTAASSSENPSSYGQSVSFMATVTNTATGAAPTGSVQFVVDGSNFGLPVALTPSSNTGMAASGATTTLMAGSHTVTANYMNADGNFTNSIGTLSGGQTVNPATTSTALSSATNPSVLGQAVGFTATVTDTSSNDSAVPMGGTVSFYDGTLLIGSAKLNAGSATFTTALLSSSPHSISASFNGDANFSASMTSSAVSQAVNARSSTTAVSLSPNTVVVGQASTLTVTVTDAATTGPSGLPGVFALTANSLNTPRTGQAAALLPNGAVLVVGGQNSGGVLSSGEIYDPSAGAFTPTTSSLNTMRTGATATLLNNGTILVVGGSSDGTAAGALSSAEIFDPIAGTFTALTGTGQSITVARFSHTATLLPNGKVVFVGGQNSSGALSTMEVYDPSSQTFTAIGDTLSVARTGHAATLLMNGTILFTGGSGLASAEIYDPVAHTSTPLTASMTTDRTNHAAVLLPDGNVLVAGGMSAGSAVKSTELYNSAAGTFAATGNMQKLRSGLTATILDSGRVLVAGGSNSTYPAVASAELYTPSFDPLGTAAVSSSDITDNITGACVLTLTGTGATTCQLADAPSEVGTNPHTIAVTYSPASDQVHSSSNNSSQSDGNNNLTVNKADTSTTVASSVNPSTYGQAVTFTATVGAVSPGSGTPTGTVQFEDNGSPIGSPVSLPTGSASVTFATSALSAGTHAITAVYSGDSNFNSTGFDSGSTATAFSQTVNPAVLTVTANPQTKIYGQPDPTLTYTATGFQFSDTTATVLTGALARAPGETVAGSPYAITQGTVTANSNYTIHFTGSSLTITPATLTITANPQTKIYGQPDPTLTYTATGFQFSDTTATVLTGALARAPGETVAGSPYAITQGTVTANSNYTIHFTGSSLTITPATLTITANPQTKVYGQPDPTLTYTATGFQFSDTTATVLTGALARAPGETVAGSPYAISQGTLTANSNYTIHFTGSSLTITPATLTITANPQTKVYGQPDPTLTYTATGFQFSDTAASVLTGALARAPGETVAGSPYAITQGTLMANSNYTIHFTGSSLTITPATLTITANPQTKVYGQPDPTLTYTATGFQFSDTAASVLTGALTRAPGETVAGSPYAITQGTLMANSNYTIHFTGSSLTITAAPLMITASSAPMIYGGPIPPIMPSYSGFVLGDTSANLATQPLCGTTATSTSSVGSYVSFCSGAVDNNYTISYAPGVVTVNQASTTTAVISSVDPSTYMQLVTLTATVLPQYSGTPTGTVTFQDTYNGNTITLGQATLSVANGQVIAIFSTANLQDTYPNTITAVYGGDSSGNGDGLGNFSASTSPAITQTVQPAANVSLNPLSLSFGNQNVNTTSKAAPVTLKNIGDATLNISANGISITGTNTSEFTQTNNCGASVAPAGFCTINVTFTPVDTGVATATLQIIDNDDDTSGAQQFVALTGAGLSTITNPGSLYTDAIFASANGCGALTFSGGSSVDSFSSVQGYGSSHNLSGGNVGTNGNVTLNGSNSAIYGTAAVDSMTTGSCGKSAMPGLTANGGAKVTGGLIPLNGPLTYPLPPAPNPTPPTTGQSVSGSCPSGMSGCTNNSGGKSVTLAPGAYGNVNASGGTAVHVGKGTYNLNSLTLSGKSILHVDSGPVVINLAGASLNGASPAMDLTGGSIENPSGVPENLQIMYAGSRGMNLSGGSASYATIYAPQALINMSGGTDFFGSIIGSTVTNSGGTTMHYDTGIPNIQAGNFIWFTAVVNNVNGLPSGPNAAQVKLYLTNASINFTSNGIPYNVPVPNAVITFNSASQTSGAKSSYDLMNARWSTSVAKTGLTGNTFVSGVAFPVPSNFPTGIQNVQFSAAYSTDTPGITLQWQWGAAVYTSFSTSYATNTNSNMLGVNPEDGSADTNGTDPAGTPEAYKVSLTFGATGGGLTNYTGFLSTGAGVVPTVAPMSASPSSVAFGAQGQGTTSTMMTAVLANNDSITHSFTGSGITIMGTNLGDFTLVPNGPGTPNNCYGTTNLTAGANCTLYVTFTPSDASTRTAKVVINDNANNSPQTVYLSGTGQ